MKLGTVVGGEGRLFQKVTRGQVKFQVAQIEPKFGEGDAGRRASAKCLSRGDVFRGQVRSKFRSNFRLLGLMSDLRRVMLDRGRE